MDVLEFRAYCLSLPLSEECTPFDETTLVYKIGGKMYAFADMVDFRGINVKCDPERAEQLREQYPETVLPGYHCNKRHWNTLRPDRDLPDHLLREWILDSYWLVVAGLPRLQRETILAAWPSSSSEASV